MDLLTHLAEQHKDDSVLVIGQYIEQLQAIAKKFDAPLITGKTPNAERDRLYGEFRSGALKLIVVSKVANFAIDLPDANVAIQVSGTFGSRQEEAQRLGRILRPKKDGSVARFYTLVTRDTKDQDFSTNRQLFLTEQGYSYRIVDAATLLPDLPERLAHMQAEFDEKRLSGQFDMEAAMQKYRAPLRDAKAEASEDTPRKRGRKPKAAAESPEEEVVQSDIAAGAEDRQPPARRRGRPPKNAQGREHLRVVK
jgi:superfamily II DNA or RNA helicase